MIRRLLPYSLTCTAMLIVLPSVTANGTPGAQVVAGLANSDIGQFVVAIAGVALLTLTFGSMVRLLVEYVSEKIDRRRMHSILAAGSRELLDDFMLPGAYGGLTRIDHGVLTQGGIFCIQTKFCVGSVSGGAEEPQWTNANGTHRRKFMNPLIQNEGRTRALRKVAPGVPVTNLVVFRDSVEFTTPMPDNAIRLSDLNRYIADFKFGPCAVRNLDVVWQAVKSSALTDEDSRKDFRAQLSLY